MNCSITYDSHHVYSSSIFSLLRKKKYLVMICSVNPIPTREGRLCPTHYYLPPIFSDLPTALSLQQKIGKKCWHNMLTPFSYKIVYIMTEVGGVQQNSLKVKSFVLSCSNSIKALSFILNFERFLVENQVLFFDLFSFTCLL